MFMIFRIWHKENFDAMFCQSLPPLPQVEKMFYLISAVWIKEDVRGEESIPFNILKGLSYQVALGVTLIQRRALDKSLNPDFEAMTLEPPGGMEMLETPKPIAL